MTQPIADNSNPSAIDLGGDLSQLSSLVSHLEEAPAPTGAVTDAQHRLIQLRLGMASSLFLALRARHAPTADHCARVALSCSAWSQVTDMTVGQRDDLEIAALLHDIGKIGIPDSILRNPKSLTSDQQALLRNSRLFAQKILQGICASEAVLTAVSHVGAWFDGTRPGYELVGNDIPIAARMIAIADAFDSMTTDRVYRKAMPQDRAIAELFRCSPTQFDPTLVEHFAGIHTTNLSQLHAQTTDRWLKTLTADTSNQYWTPQAITMHTPGQATNSDELYFHERLIDNLQHGIVYVDANMRIRRWNHACEQLTGLPSHGVTNEQWNPELLNLRSDDGRLVREAECPVHRTLHSGSPMLAHMMIKGYSGNHVPVEFHAIPIVDSSGGKLGVTVVMRDWSSEKDLKQRVERLHLQATSDPLTRVANRSEFDRSLEETVLKHLQNGASCSLIICDIDHFKKVNDTFGHQAGDEVLISFAALLARSSRSGDLVARYGGEEFVIICDNCGCNEAYRLAEKLRLELSRTPFQQLDRQFITASFGVTEVQRGDTPEIMLRRADRGLLEAKELGRNCVVQLGAGMKPGDESEPSFSWLDWIVGRPKSGQKLVETYLVNNVPVDLMAEKLRGFIADHNAKIVSLDDDGILLEISDENSAFQRRRSDRGTPFQLHVAFVRKAQHDAGGRSQSILCVSVRPTRVRDRRANLMDAARHLISSFKSYLVAQDFCPDQSDEYLPLEPADWQRALTRK